MKVLLLAGGESGEREVSLHSGEAVLAALKRLGHEVVALDPATGTDLLDAEGCFLSADQLPKLPRNGPTAPPGAGLLAPLSKEKLTDVEVVFIALHGGTGENGSIQCLLDLAGMKYTGAGMTASAVAMNKDLAKRIVASEHIKTPKWALCKMGDGEPDDELLGNILYYLKLPLIVKPNDSGSTLGLTKVDRQAGLPEALKTAARESHDVLVEEYVAGRELTVAVLDGEALPVVEIKAKSGLYDYEAKYSKGKSEYFVPADVPEEVAEAVQKSAVTACELFGIKGLARVDFILDEYQHHWFLEANTLPGMTDLSLAPMAAGAVGINFDQFIERLLQSALKT